MTPEEEEAQVAAYIASGKMQRIPTVHPEDAAVDGMLKQIRDNRKAKSLPPKWRRSTLGKRSRRSANSN